MYSLFAVGLGQAVLKSHVCILDQKAKEMVEQWMRVAQLVKFIPVEQQCSGGLQRLNRIDGRLPGEKTIQIRNPVSFQSKLYGMFIAFLINDK